MMTQQETEALAARLLRIWQSPQPELAEWRLYTDEIPVFQFKAPLAQGIEIVYQQGESITNISLTRKDEQTITGCLSCNDRSPTIKTTTAVLDRYDPKNLRPQYAQFANLWLDTFRRGCWLSGIPLEATAHEKIEWMQGFTRQELEEWHLKFLAYPQFEQIIQRVAAAFEVNALEALAESSEGISFTARKGLLSVRLVLTHEGELSSLQVGDKDLEHDSSLEFDSSEYSEQNQWFFHSNPPYDEELARTFYRLGFEDEPVFRYEGVLAELPPLTAHEKLELRLTMPREFWPQKWHDEEEEGVRSKWDEMNS